MKHKKNESGNWVECKYCGNKIKKNSVETDILLKKTYNDHYVYKDEKTKTWYFCNRKCKFNFLDDRGYKEKDLIDIYKDKIIKLSDKTTIKDLNELNLYELIRLHQKLNE